MAIEIAAAAVTIVAGVFGGARWARRRLAGRRGHSPVAHGDLVALRQTAAEFVGAVSAAAGRLTTLGRLKTFRFMPASAAAIMANPLWADMREVASARARLRQFGVQAVEDAADAVLERLVEITGTLRMPRRELRRVDLEAELERFGASVRAFEYAVPHDGRAPASIEDAPVEGS